MNKMKLLQKAQEEGKKAGNTLSPQQQNEQSFFNDKPSWWKELDVVWGDELHSYIKTIKATQKNYKLIIKHDELLKDKIKLNELDKMIYFFEPITLNLEGDTVVLEGTPNDVAHDEILDYLSDKYSEYNFKENKDVYYSAINAIAERNSYNPIKEYIKYCHKQWLAQDKPEMITNLFPKYLGTDKNETNDLISKIWLTELVTRPFVIKNPADYVLNLVGPQGCGKTLMFNVLGSIPMRLSDSFIETESYTTEWQYSSFSNKDFDLDMISSWIVVDEEMKVRKKSDVESYKGKISSMVGKKKIRAAYRRDPQSYDVFCTIGGTSNVTTFLKDPTGNRRELPLLCRPEKAEIKLNGQSKEQCWKDCQLAIGQAYQLYLDGYEYLIRTDGEEKLLEQTREQFKENDSAGDELDLYLEDKDIVMTEELVRRINTFSSVTNNNKVTTAKVNSLMLQYSNQWVRKKGRLNKKIKTHYLNIGNLDNQELGNVVGETLAKKIRDKESKSLVAYYVRRGGKFD